ncbi:MAG: MarR family transcriptional regulator [Culturomica sp.]|jgi:DNA-binding MarR family transcriptional regulator|nr:MarR family transcriptional regulator [Culturomica sp.]
MKDVSELVNYLSKVERGYTKQLNRSFQKAGYDLSREQYELLKVLWESDNVNQQTIAKKIEKDKYNVTKLLNTLSKRGFLRRITSDKDKRNNLIVLTEKGIASRKALTDVEEQIHTDLAFTIAPDEIKNCLWILKKFNNLLK